MKNNYSKTEFGNIIITNKSISKRSIILMILLFFTFFISRKLNEDTFNSVNLTMFVSYTFIAINKIFEVIKFIIRKIKKINSSKNNIPKKFECFYNSFNYLFYIFSLLLVFYFLVQRL